MTPSNQPNGNPLIYRICDALGVFHIVAPVDHTHAQSEIEGLVAALAAKANAAAVETALAGKQNTLTFDTTPTENSTNPVTSGGVKVALNGKANVLHGHDGIGGTSTAQDASVSCEQDTVRITAENEVVISIEGQEVSLNVDNYDNLVRALANPDTTPTANSNKLVTSGGVKAAIDALLTNYIPIHQVTAILPKTTGQESEQELQNWLGDGKMALVLQTARPVEVSIEATGVDDAPDGTWSGSTDISFDLGQGVRTVKNIYDLMDAQLQNDYPGERIGYITGWKIKVYAKDTAPADTICLINFYNPTINE